ncbi:MAG: dihydropteroate synthase [Actinomycetota bacterium]|jgi:5-methyltetrahydrofolate corrinoid/iron sulfur protein methyltransferase|nr:dihydropteroate synthase [Actinomycetota bacterium]
MLIIGENISVTSKIVGDSIRNRDAGPIIKMAKVQKEAGAHYIDVNIGPATKNGEELMQWVVKTIQGEVETPLALDTKNTSAMEAGLEVHKGAAMINSVTGDQDKLDILMPMAKKYGAKIVGIALSEKGVPPDVDSRIEIIMNIVNSAMEQGLPLSDLYLDPIVLPVAVLQPQVLNCIEGLKAFKQLKELMGLPEEPKTIVGLSNVSQSSPAELKSLLNRTYLLILLSHGLDSAILDPLDSDLMHAVKTFDILTNRILYAHSYLDK